MAANYDNSAWFYDRLSRLIYGRAIINSQLYLLNYIPAGASVLIAGGGTGWILDEITKRHSSGLNITYVEISAKMMALSRKRNTGGNRITYINDAVENIHNDRLYDVIITPFLFDNFTGDTLQTVFGHIHRQLKPNGLWLNNDFQLTGKWWQQVLLKSMFLFFRLICGIEADGLPAIKQQFDLEGYKLIDNKTFFGEFILAQVYQKTESKKPTLI